MTTPTFINAASGDARVDSQIGVVHGNINNYHVAPDALPEEVFRVGVELLKARMPAEARELIERAVARGFETDEVRFYRLLALLSGRNLRQLENEDIERLHAICSRLPELKGGEAWTDALRTVLALIGSLPAADATQVDKELDSLPTEQRNLIVDHLGVLLEGPMEDELWRRSVELAFARRTSDDRTDRVWTFFQPTPAHPRAREVQPASYRGGDLVGAAVGLIVLLYALGNIASLVLRLGEAAPFIAILVAVVGSLVAVRYGAGWYFRRRRIRAKDAELIRREPPSEAPNRGFAHSIDVLFDRYFGRYVPRGADPAVWTASTAGIRQRLRDEIVEIYREDRVQAKELAWLVRFLVADVRQRWDHNTLFAYRGELRTPHREKAACMAGLAAVGAGWFVIVGTVSLSGAAWGLLAAIAGTAAARRGLSLDSERRRVGADTAERHDRLQERQRAYERWTLKLSVKPTDPEMADWLESDRRVLVDFAMRHYRLTASQIIAHAAIEGPGPGTKRARVKHGPWRFSRYRIVLFLLTKDGVRQIDVDVDFEHAIGQVTQRLNYRFDAVAAVRINGLATQRLTFELALVNGSAITMAVTEAIDEVEIGEDRAKLSEVSLDASGLPRTLNILEGIAAEGKAWIFHQHRRTASRLADLSRIVREAIGEPPKPSRT